MALLDEDLERLAERVVEKLDERRKPVTPRLMDLETCGKYLGRSLSAIQHLVKKGLLPVTKLDGKLQIDRVVLDKLIEKNKGWLK
jgi:hypothetical protein